MSIVFKNRLKKCRVDKQLSQTTIADMLNITRQAYNHYETGQRQPTQDTLLKLADYFDCSVDYLLGRTDHAKGYELSEKEQTLIDEYKILRDKEKEEVENYVRMKAEPQKLRNLFKTFEDAAAAIAYGGDPQIDILTEEQKAEIRKLLKADE